MLQSMRSAAKYIWLVVALVFVGVFVFAETSGLTSRPRTLGSTVATVNGQNVTVEVWERNLRSRLEQVQREAGRALNQDEEERVKDELFNGIVTDILLDQEYRRRNITVTDQEIREAFQSYPHPELMRNPTFQTEGRFDPEKYQRYVTSPQARQDGVLLFLEQYYRSEIPKQKLFEEIASTVYVTDNQLWRIWQDANDSAQVSFVSFRTDLIPDSVVAVSDAEIKTYFDAHKKDYEDRPGRAVVSVTKIPRVVTAADSAAVRARAIAFRDEILGGAKFEDVARRESADTVSGAQGGSLGRGAKGRFVPEFEKAAYELEPGKISEPVLSPFGYHLIRVDERKGDTLSARHILLNIQQSDSSASRTSQRADSLEGIARPADSEPAFDKAVKSLGLPAGRIVAIEGEPATWNGEYVDGASAWAFSGVRPGELSDLIDAEQAYYLLRLDSLYPGGEAELEDVRDEVREMVSREKQIRMLEDRAGRLASSVTSGSRTLEQAAQSQGLNVEKTPMFNRLMPVPGLGQLNEAVGAAFGLPVGAVSAPISTRNGVFLVRVDRRANADRAAWEAQKATQRQTVLRALRQQKVQEFVNGLRENAEIKDNRKELEQAGREVVS
ncbi:MAG: peptidyl-prolyl cis-trans isomerase [Gemmatimonadaceae bacterium]